jgi:hypothetical protein
MILPMMGFFAMLIVVGGLGSLVAIADPSRANLAPYTFAMLFAGPGVYVRVFGFGFLGEQLFNIPVADSVAFFGGALIGSLGGAILGLVIGRNHHRRINH